MPLFYPMRVIGPLLTAGCLPLAAAELVVLEPMVVTATRSAQPASILPVNVTVFTREALRASPALAIDDTLRAEPAFSLFRRAGSLTANPTAQGVSLRGLGPSGASRSLVLLDGIPVNDPFGGWVAWNKLPRLSLATAEIVRGGGSGLWGNSALGGTVQLLTASPPDNRAAVETLAGDFRTRAVEVAVTRTTADHRTRVTVDAATFATSGVALVRDPGPIDRPADLDYHRVQVTARRVLAESLALTLTGRIFAEQRGNGTPLQRNSSDEAFVSIALANSSPALATPPFAWSAVLYAQDQSFASFFSTVNAARTAETPANDQYAVPASAVGGALTAAWNADSATTTLGLDARRVAGETRERFNFALGPYDRRAGGEQTFLGLFARHDRALGPHGRASVGARLDDWQNTGGFRRETGPVPLDQRFADRDGVAFSPNLGLVWQPAPVWRVRSSAYRAFRVPTLNEYHRPFRVGAVTTNANPDLTLETLTGGETGLDLGRPGAPLVASFTVFSNELHDAVTNVTVAPNTRQRRNLDRVRVQGLEASLRARPHPALDLAVASLLADARVTSPGPVAPAALDGNRLAQVPRHTVTASLDWRAPLDLRLTTRARWVSAQFEDDENTLRLAPAATVDLRVSRSFARRWEVFLATENVFAAAVETGSTAAGVVSVAPPRWSRVGLRFDW